jgi:hypothetical protein
MNFVYVHIFFLHIRRGYKNRAIVKTMFEFFADFLRWYRMPAFHVNNIFLLQQRPHLHARFFFSHSVHMGRRKFFFSFLVIFIMDDLKLF